MRCEPAASSRPPIGEEQLAELRHVLDWYDDLPQDRFGDPLTLAVLVEEFALAARTILEPANDPAGQNSTNGVHDGDEPCHPL